MLTKNEVSALTLSPTKKDFVQIWNELLDVAGKLSERWDPTSTNESDPGIVILKALTGIADRLNYNIDKNILEAFMPTVAQEDSMRKLCDMLGYSMKYYRSAITDVTIKYYNSEPSDDEYAAMNNSNGGLGLEIPRFTVITNGDQDVNYFTINQLPMYISATNTSITITCMEGQPVKCESANDNNVITAEQISNNRFYLPETQIAENGVFIYDVSTSKYGSALTEGTQWKTVTNLNTQARGAKVFKFGFDSYRSRPYVEFPDDYSELFNEGIFIYYTRTSGVNGNISSRTLTQLALPSTEGWSSVSADSFSVENLTSATSGANAESISQAYTNFKKTVGTFETLVTCRDYMNKIYSLTKGNTGAPLVSNALVTDIRNDLNRAITICSCDGAGIFYKETSLFDSYAPAGEANIQETKEEYSGYEHVETIQSLTQSDRPEYSDFVPLETNTIITTSVASTANKPVYSAYPYGINIGGDVRKTCWRLGSVKGLPLFADEYSSFITSGDFNVNADGNVVDTDENGEPSYYWHIIQDDRRFVTNLVIDRINSTETFVKEQRTATIREHHTETIREQRIKTITNTESQLKTVKNKIDHFDLVLYPFKSYNQIKNNVRDIRAVYDASFEYAGTRTLNEITDILASDDSVKTVAHNIKAPENGDIVSINNYLKLSATIATNSKVTTDEGILIKENIKMALANAFNMHELDFGEEIPFDQIVEVIEKADARIKVASLNEPAMYTTFSVLDTSSGTPAIQEYAVASEWLDVAGAEATDRLTRKTKDNKIESTFDTAYARELYNKLAVRNVLAGRVPLFDYNTLFTSSFAEAPYQVSGRVVNLDELPEGFTRPSKDNSYTIYTDSDSEITYIGEWTALAERPEMLAEPTPSTPTTEAEDSGLFYQGVLEDGKYEYSQTMYTKMYTPEVFKDNLIGGTVNDAGDVEDYITELTAHCTIPADEAGVVSDVKLESGEVISFRAPNFITTKTYPAYVNYHLKLASNKATTSPAQKAEAMSLYSLLNADVDKAKNAPNATTNWQRVLDYFTLVDEANGWTDTPDAYVKTFKIQQEISAFTPAGDKSEEEISLGDIVIKIDNNPAESSSYTPETLMALSGCVKLLNENFTAELAWAEGENISGEVPLQTAIKLEIANPFITNTDILVMIKDSVQTTINDLRSAEKDGKPILPTQGAWTVSFTFSCVPFEARSLDEWGRFISSEYKNLSAIKNEDIAFLKDFEPQSETSVFWRKFGEGYDIGKYITEDTAKLLPFTVNYFGLLPATRLHGVFVAKDLGANAELFVIKNDEEYQLKNDECLYIEYTPSTTTADGSTKPLASVTEVLGPGSIIRPSGFGTGLIDSSVYAKSNTPNKTASFATATGSSEQISLHSLGASEQIELRELAAVKLPAALNKDSFASSSIIYIYKNFNNCPELECIDVNAKNERINNSYILKDGEYIFYTDPNKSELAYYTSGTQVTLYGNVKLPQYDIIELSDIFEAGFQDLMDNHMTRLAFDTKDDTIEFQEYQYITLAAGDTLSSLVLSPPKDGSTFDKKYLDSDWKYCSEAELSFAEDPSTVKVLPSINISSRDGCGWEACSTMDLAVSPNYAQTLRSTPKLNTKLQLVRTKVDGGIVESEEVIDPSIYGENSKLSFKTNLDCVACGNKISIDNVLSNPDNLKSFQLKVFAANSPAIFTTKPGTVIPMSPSGSVSWQQSYDILKKTDNKDLWYQKDLEDLRISAADEELDKALQLSVGLLPNTYGIFSIYLDFKTPDDMSAWIEVLPGTTHDDITLLNVEKPIWIIGDSKRGISDKLKLNSGLNCVKVAKNCRVYIKASANAKGTLLFDELRLVNSKSVRYTNAFGKTVTQKTHGLNLKQLGYLNVTNSSDASELARESLCKAYVEQALADIQAEETNSYKDFSVKRSLVQADKSKVASVVALEKAFNMDLASLADTNVARRKTLVDIYNKVNSSLINEKELLAALDNSADVENLERQLVTLLKGIASTDLAKQQILESWTKLHDELLSVAQDLPDNTILEDFEQSTHHNDPNIISEIKTTAIDKINAQYDAQIANLANTFEQVTDSTEGKKLFNLLQTQQADKNSVAWDKINLKIAELTSLVSEDVNGSTDDLMTAANTLDFTKLLDGLSQLRRTVDNSGISMLISSIAAAAEESNDKLLSELIAPLFAVADEVNLDAVINTDLLDDIDHVNTLVQNNMLAETPDKAAVVKAINSLKEDITLNYENNLKTAFKSIKTILETISKEAAYDDNVSKEITISTLISSLEASTDDRVSKILCQVKQIIDERYAYLTACNELDSLIGWQNTDCSSFIRASILDKWPGLLYTRLHEVLSKIDKIFIDIVTTSEINIFELSRTRIIRYLSPEANYVTNSLLLNIPADKILALFNEFENYVDTDTQNMADTQLINKISTLMPVSTELSNALDNNLNDNLIIHKLVLEYNSATDVSQKQQTLAILRAKLNSTIDTNQQLFEVISTLLWPKLTNELKSNNISLTSGFFNKLYEVIKAAKAEMLEGNTVLRIPVDDDYLALVECEPEDFDGALLVFNASESCLSDDYLKLISTTEDLLRYSLKVKTEAESIYTKKETLTTSETVIGVRDSLGSISDKVYDILTDLASELKSLETSITIDKNYTDAYEVLLLERQLLAEIMAKDKNREFYYNVPIENSVAIDFNEVNGNFNTLMSPAIYYDVNNINNSFVISKLDIDYLSSGIQIARSSRYN